MTIARPPSRPRAAARAIQCIRPSLADGFVAAWRWQAAGELARLPRTPRGARDPLIARAAAYLRVLNRSHDDKTRLLKMAARYPDIHPAQRLHADGGQRRYLIEALAAAGADAAKIAEHVPIDTQVIQVYLDLFFDVVWLLPHRAALLSVLVPAYMRWQANDPDVSWKLLAFQLGVDLFLKFILPGSELTDAENETLARLARDELSKKIFTAVLALRPTGSSALKVLDLGARLPQPIQSRGFSPSTGCRTSVIAIGTMVNASPAFERGAEPAALSYAAS